jgi:indole-3-glycerol phosphate synthase
MHILLNCGGTLSRPDVKQLATFAHSFGLEVLLEVHNEERVEG